MTFDATAKELRERLDAATEALYDTRDALTYAEEYYSHSNEYYKICWREWLDAKHEHASSLRELITYVEKGN